MMAFRIRLAGCLLAAAVLVIAIAGTRLPGGGGPPRPPRPRPHTSDAAWVSETPVRMEKAGQRGYV